jgi:pyruvate dehydrogenase (quinone)
MDDDAELVAILGKLLSKVNPHTFADYRIRIRPRGAATAPARSSVQCKKMQKSALYSSKLLVVVNKTVTPIEAEYRAACPGADKVTAKSNTKFWDQVTKERRNWDEMLDKQADPARSKDRIHPQAVARAVSDFAKRDAVFIFDTGLNTLWSANWIRQSGARRIIGSFNNAAVGTALGQANGIQVLDRSRQVIALCGDGGFNMLMCEFLTAVQHKLPVKVVVYNNSAFGLISFEAESVGLPAYKKGTEFPNPDFAALAHACGGHGFKAAKPGELKDAISEAFKVDGPAIIDAVVAADEMPNLPHIDLETVSHFAMAKIKEAVLTVTRS